MTTEITINAEPRETRGKNEARRLRVKGLTPAVLYGAGKDSVPVAVNPKEVNKILHSRAGHNTIFNLAIQGGEDTPAMIVDWQNDPVKDNLLHVDMKRIDLSKRIVVKVRVATTGEPQGVKVQGGLLEIIGREIEIECLPNEIPQQFTMDVTELMIGDNLRASDIPLTGSMKLLSQPEQVIAHVVTMKAEEVAAPAAEGVVEATAATPAEPEVIKKGKKEEVPEAGAEPEKGKKK
ncbi:MAG TPA: 50S ribosomal protein L25 [Bryobacteraceae bacterium]|nr:50S ribosomal protein L25 [Bryobacteraceae bacterium]